MKMKYNVQFAYYGNMAKLDEGIQQKVESVYFYLYNQFVEQANPLYASWNDEFDQYNYDPCDGYTSKYNQFIKGKQLEITNEINRKMECNIDESMRDFICHLGIGDENNPILYIPKLGTFESGDYVDFFLV